MWRTLEDFWMPQEGMVNGELENSWKFEEFGDSGGTSGDKDCAFPHARRHTNNEQVQKQYIRQERVQNEVLTISSKSDNLRLDIGNINDEGDHEGIGNRNGAKFLYRASTWKQGCRSIFPIYLSLWTLIWDFWS
jgi:hypothetical protein